MNMQKSNAKAEEVEDKHKRYRAVFEGWLMLPRKASGEVNHMATSLSIVAPKGPFTVDLYKVDDKWNAVLLPVMTKFGTIRATKERLIADSNVESYFEKKVSDWVAIPD